MILHFFRRVFSLISNRGACIFSALIIFQMLAERKSVAIWMDYPETVCFPIANHANSIWYNERVYNQYLFTCTHFSNACRLHALKIIDTDAKWNLCITYLSNARVKFRYKTSELEKRVIFRFLNIIIESRFPYISYDRTLSHRTGHLGDA